MTIKPKAKIIPVRYNPGNEGFQWTNASVVFDKEEPRGKKGNGKQKQTGA